MSSILKYIAPRRAAINLAKTRSPRTISSTTLPHKQSTEQKCPIVPFRRTYANEPSRGATTRGEPNATNVRDSPSSSGEASQVNSARGIENVGAETKPTAANPVSNPEEGGMGVQEESQPSQENMKRPKEEPDHIKRQHVETEGQKPLDPADGGHVAIKRDPNK
ncbi:hypothetical protein CBER1_02961 [Cercospora berteroae]|uniref:Uncharacterized protein n=1 Tax=Cercospora berteroae TaxID=357750 RepID=A0A2S6C2T0_9PEZI|nr:hypothetical protein CBER1_02961 [Cercospora berteroae]